MAKKLDYQLSVHTQVQEINGISQFCKRDIFFSQIYGVERKNLLDSTSSGKKAAATGSVGLLSAEEIASRREEIRRRREEITANGEQKGKELVIITLCTCIKTVRYMVPDV